MKRYILIAMAALIASTGFALAARADLDSEVLDAFMQFVPADSEGAVAARRVYDSTQPLSPTMALLQAVRNWDELRPETRDQLSRHIEVSPWRDGQRFPERPEPLHWRVVGSQAVALLRRPRFWLFFAAMFVAGGGELCLTFWSASYIQLSFTPAPWAGGLGTACFAAGMMVGRTGWGYFIKQHQLRTLLLASGLAGALITLSFPSLENLYVFFGLLFLAGIATAPFWPTVQSYCADRLPGADTTMLFILLSCAGIPGCGFFTWLMGTLADRADGLRTAFYLVPGCFLTLVALIALDSVCKTPAHRGAAAQGRR